MIHRVIEAGFKTDASKLIAVRRQWARDLDFSSLSSILERIELSRCCHRNRERPERAQHPRAAGMLGDDFQ
jgi:hypothetical protein